MENVEINRGKLRRLYRYALSFQLSVRGGMCGQAFTDYTCLKCGMLESYHNTNVPIFCDTCSTDIKDEYERTKFCPCGGIILADTENWETPLCIDCYDKRGKNEVPT